MLVLHFGSCLGCVEPVLIEWSVSCLGGGGAQRKLNGSDSFLGFEGFSGSYGHVIMWMLLTWALFGMLICIWGGLSCPLSWMRLFCVWGEWVLGLRSIL